MKKVLIFILSTVVIQSYAAIQWNCTSPDMQQSYLPKECTGIGSGSTSASSGSSPVFGINLSGCTTSTYNDYKAGKIDNNSASADSGPNNVCLNSLVNKLNLPDGYLVDPANTSAGCGEDDCNTRIGIKIDGSLGMTLTSTYPAPPMIKAQIPDPDNVIICTKLVPTAVCPAGTYTYVSNTDMTLKKN